jgi:thiol-disulfide isomerase/thioredoxin
MNRRNALTIGVAGVALAAGAGFGWWSERRSALPEAERALWDLQFDRPEGGSLPLAGLRGQPLLLNFWATWCAPCVKEMPLLDAFQRTHQPAGWRVVGLAVDSPTPVREFLKKLPVTFPASTWPARSATSAAGCPSVPSSAAMGASSRANWAASASRTWPPGCNNWAEGPQGSIRLPFFYIAVFGP